MHKIQIAIAELFSNKHLLALALAWGLSSLSCIQADQNKPETVTDPGAYGPGRIVGRLQDTQLVECSGMDTSNATPGLLWAINDGRRSPFLFALGPNGQALGRVWVKGADNRDWEGLDTFVWKGRPMILIADMGDNRRRHDSHTLYIIDEPMLKGGHFESPAVADVAWRITFSYPDGRHDAEGVAVDIEREKVIILTKRDTPPILFEVPLAPPQSGQPAIAKKIAMLDPIEPPAKGGLFSKYAHQPTALDISNDGLKLVVLTYTDAYMYTRGRRNSWSEVLSGKPKQIKLPHPLDMWELRQREAICFGWDDRDLWITSEGSGAGILRLKLNDAKTANIFLIEKEQRK